MVKNTNGRLLFLSIEFTAVNLFHCFMKKELIKMHFSMKILLYYLSSTSTCLEKTLLDKRKKGLFIEIKHA